MIKNFDPIDDIPRPRKYDPTDDVLHHDPTDGKYPDFPYIDPTDEP